MSKFYSNINLNSRSNSSSRGFYFRKQRNKKVFRKKPSIKKMNRSFSLFDRFDNISSFYFQLAGISMITFAVVLSFFSLFDFTTTRTSADSQSVRVLTNFQGNEYTRQSNPQLVEIQPEPVPVEEAKPEPTYYIVKSGDSIFSISSELSVSVDDLISLNDLEDPRNIKVDQKLIIVEQN